MPSILFFSDRDRRCCDGEKTTKRSSHVHLTARCVSRTHLTVSGDMAAIFAVHYVGILKILEFIMWGYLLKVLLKKLLWLFVSTIMLDVLLLLFLLLKEMQFQYFYIH